MSWGWYLDILLIFWLNFLHHNDHTQSKCLPCHSWEQWPCKHGDWSPAINVWRTRCQFKDSGSSRAAHTFQTINFSMVIYFTAQGKSYIYESSMYSKFIIQVVYCQWSCLQLEVSSQQFDTCGLLCDLKLMDMEI